MGCQTHPPLFMSDATARKLITFKKSNLRDAGRGVFNGSSADSIEAGVVFGPYVGELIKPSAYKKQEKENKESGYAWELLDSALKKRVIGYIDPGQDPDPKIHWLSLINCANTKSQQNIEVCQFNGRIYYHVCSPIAPKKELLTHYGPKYNVELGIIGRRFEEEVGFKKNLTVEEYNEMTKCRFCNVAFAIKEAFKKHNCRKTKQEHDGPFSCAENECQAKFMSPEELHKHEENGQHLKVKPFKCEDCEKQYLTRSNLNQHRRQAHENIKFRCKECNKEFGLRFNLMKHKIALHQKKKVKCLQCQKTFSQKGHMKTHLENVHQGLLSYVCHICFKGFGQGGNCDKHIAMVHVKEKKCVCPRCPQSFFQTSDLAKHVQAVHKI